MFGCNHSYHLDKTDSYIQYIVFKFICNKCGHPKTVIREFGSGFEVKVE